MIPWRKWQTTPGFLPGKYHGQSSLVGYSPWGPKDLDTTEQLTQYYYYHYFGFIFLFFFFFFKALKFSGYQEASEKPSAISGHVVKQDRDAQAAGNTPGCSV